jgi:GntR family transcriptional regulator
VARELDDLSGVPRYLQVARVVESEIRSGTWEVGNPIESRNQLAKRFGIAQMTAAKAHSWLADHGYIVAVPGVGMLVTPQDRWTPDPPAG